MAKRNRLIEPNPRYWHHYYWSATEGWFYVLGTQKEFWKLLPVNVDGKRRGEPIETAYPLCACHFANRPFKVEHK